MIDVIFDLLFSKWPNLDVVKNQCSMSIYVKDDSGETLHHLIFYDDVEYLTVNLHNHVCENVSFKTSNFRYELPDFVDSLCKYIEDNCVSIVKNNYT